MAGGAKRLRLLGKVPDKAWGSGWLAVAAAGRVKMQEHPARERQTVA